MSMVQDLNSTNGQKRKTTNTQFDQTLKKIQDLSKYVTTYGYEAAGFDPLKGVTGQINQSLAQILGYGYSATWLPPEVLGKNFAKVPPEVLLQVESNVPGGPRERLPSETADAFDVVQDLEAAIGSSTELLADWEQQGSHFAVARIAGITRAFIIPVSGGNSNIELSDVAVARFLRDPTWVAYLVLPDPGAEVVAIVRRPFLETHCPALNVLQDAQQVLLLIVDRMLALWNTPHVPVHVTVSSPLSGDFLILLDNVDKDAPPKEGELPPVLEVWHKTEEGEWAQSYPENASGIQLSKPSSQSGENLEEGVSESETAPTNEPSQPLSSAKVAALLYPARRPAPEGKLLPIHFPKLPVFGSVAYVDLVRIYDENNTPNKMNELRIPFFAAGLRLRPLVNQYLITHMFAALACGLGRTKDSNVIPEELPSEISFDATIYDPFGNEILESVEEKIKADTTLNADGFETYVEKKVQEVYESQWGGKGKVPSIIENPDFYLSVLKEPSQGGNEEQAPEEGGSEEQPAEGSEGEGENQGGAPVKNNPLEPENLDAIEVEGDPQVKKQVQAFAIFLTAECARFVKETAGNSGKDASKFKLRPDIYKGLYNPDAEGSGKPVQITFSLDDRGANFDEMIQFFIQSSEKFKPEDINWTPPATSGESENPIEFPLEPISTDSRLKYQAIFNQFFDTYEQARITEMGTIFFVEQAFLALIWATNRQSSGETSEQFPVIISQLRVPKSQQGVRGDYNYQIVYAGEDSDLKLETLEITGKMGSAKTQIATRVGKFLNNVKGITEATVAGVSFKRGTASGHVMQLIRIEKGIQEYMKRKMQKWKDLVASAK